MQTDPWIDRDATSLHKEGHRVGLFVVEGGLEWWAYPAGWKPRGTVEAKGPFCSRNAAKASLDAGNWQTWITPQIDFERGTGETQRMVM